MTSRTSPEFAYAFNRMRSALSASMAAKRRAAQERHTRCRTSAAAVWRRSSSRFASMRCIENHIRNRVCTKIMAFRSRALITVIACSVPTSTARPTYMVATALRLAARARLRLNFARAMRIKDWATTAARSSRIRFSASTILTNACTTTEARWNRRRSCSRNSTFIRAMRVALCLSRRPGTQFNHLL